MRSSTTSLLCIASSCIALVASLPQPGLKLRAHSTIKDKPKYSVISLEPSEDDELNGSPGDGKGDGTVTITQTAQPTTVKFSAPPTSASLKTKAISIVDLVEELETTVYIVPTTTQISTIRPTPVEPTIDIAVSSTLQSSRDTSTVLPQSTLIKAELVATATSSFIAELLPTTLSTLTTSSVTYDDGQWKTTYAPWNETKYYQTV